MKQNESFPYLALLVVLLCAGMLVSLIHPSQTFSAAENRELQQRVMRLCSIEASRTPLLPSSAISSRGGKAGCRCAAIS